MAIYAFRKLNPKYVTLAIMLMLTFIVIACNSLSNQDWSEINLQNSSGNNIECGTGTFDFGNLILNHSTTETFTIQNTGKADLILSGSPMVYISNPNSSVFEVITQPTTPIQPGQTTIFTIKFTPNSTQNHIETVSIRNNDRTENPYIFTVTGTGQTNMAEIDIKQNATSILSGTGSYDFGNISVNKSSGDIDFKIDNVGNEDLNLTGIQKVEISGVDASMFAVKDTMTTTPIAPGNSTSFKINFTPKSSGLKTATITIANDDSDENPYTFDIEGTGTAPEIQVSQSGNNIANLTGNHSYGSVPVSGNTAPVIFTIENIGTEDLKLLGSPYISITGTSASMFDLNQTLTTSPISPSNKTTFTISFKPTVMGFHNADVTILNNDTDEGTFTFTLTATAVNSTYYWTRKFGDTGQERLNASIMDSSENIYLAGGFEKTVNFAVEFNLFDNKTSKGNSDIFVTKIDANGSYLWTKQFGGSDTEWALGIATDASGNVYVTGIFSGTIDFGADFSVSDSLTASGQDIFVTKINANGTYGWTKKIGDTGDDLGSCVVTDTSGNIYVAGKFQGTVDFGTPFGSSESKTSSGGDDAFITKINANSTYGWTKIFGGTGSDLVNSITLSSAGDIYFTGSFENTVDFAKDFSSTDNKSSQGQNDIFITKLTSVGNYDWTKVFGSTGNDYGYSVVLNSLNEVLFCGSFENTVNFQADFGGTDNKTSAGASDVFITKLTSTGAYGLTRRFGGSGSDSGNAITVDSNNSIYITGSFQGTADFGTDFATSDSKTANGNDDVFITKISSTIAYLWTNKLGGPDSEFGNSIFTDSRDDLYISGIFKSTINFAAEFGGNDAKTAIGNYDAFITKILNQ